MRWRARIEPLARPLMQAWWRMRRGATLGVRTIAERPDGAVVLVRHTYIDGWYLPGGGVEAGETAAYAAERELAEEAGVQLTQAPRLLGVYANHARFRGDHVLLFHASDWVACDTDSAGEIERIEWFLPTQLPADTSPGTRRRLAEHYGDTERDGHW